MFSTPKAFPFVIAPIPPGTIGTSTLFNATFPFAVVSIFIAKGFKSAL